MKKTYNRLSQEDVVHHFLGFFVYAQEEWCRWDKLEDAIAVVRYEELSDSHLNWFIEFLANVCLRVWKSSKEETELNRVEEFEEGFFIKNYDWNAFKFGKQHGVNKYVITKTTLTLDKDNLKEKEVKWLRSRCQQ